jgi:hypothetical protein
MELSQWRMTRDQLAALVSGLGHLLAVLATAAPEDKAAVYRRLGLRLTYDPARRVVTVESHLGRKSVSEDRLETLLHALLSCMVPGQSSFGLLDCPRRSGVRAATGRIYRVPGRQS